MDSIAMLFHVHTQASFDGIMSVKHILKYCKRHDIKILAICDHDSLDMVEKARQIGLKIGVYVISAIEYSTDAGDIIGIFVTNKIESNNCVKILNSIRIQGGLSVLPHPLKGHKIEKIPFEMIDIIEVFNPRCNSKENVAAEYLSELHNKAKIVGVDAHLPWELGLAVNYFSYKIQKIESLVIDDIKKLLLASPRYYKCRFSTLLNIQISQFVKGVKLGNFELIYQSSKGILVALLGRRSLQ